MFWGRVRQASGSFHISAYCVGIWNKMPSNIIPEALYPSRPSQLKLHYCMFVCSWRTKKSEIVILYYVYTCFRRCCKKNPVWFVVYFCMTLFIHFFSTRVPREWMWKCRWHHRQRHNIFMNDLFFLYRIWHFLTCCVDSFTYYV